MKKLLVTGGAGFIGSHFVQEALQKGYSVVVIDKLTYAASLANLEDYTNHPNYQFILGDINDETLIEELLQSFQPNAVINFAAETHVDNSIASPFSFITTNINGVFNLLNCSLKYYRNLSSDLQLRFCFIQVSTDEVYGSLNFKDQAFNINSNYAPNSPYSASKAAGDHLARAWFITYKLPVIITNCSNNYGPYQHKEKLIPKTVINALNDQEIPVYGKGKNIRDWIYVTDHVQGILLALEHGMPGGKYLFGGDSELSNLELIELVCNILEEMTGKNYKHLIKFVEDRLGHDLRYAINNKDVMEKLNFSVTHDLTSGLSKTIRWYIDKYKGVK